MLALAFPVGILLFFGYRLLRLLQQRADWHLGFSGERCVGEELNKLMADGCAVFHDLQIEPGWNIDHVIVAPSGVYAVETKARRKPKSPDGRNGYKIIFDGTQLQFPNSTGTDGLDQVRRNADSLGQFLTKATGEPVKAKAILTFPGWWVERTGKSIIAVLNHREIRSCVVGGQAKELGETQRQRIIHQLDQKCRDVEF